MLAGGRGHLGSRGIGDLREQAIGSIYEQVQGISIPPTLNWRRPRSPSVYRVPDRCKAARAVGMWALSLLSLSFVAVRGFVSVPQRQCHRLPTIGFVNVQTPIQTDRNRLLRLFDGRRNDDDEEGFRRRDEASAWMVPAQMLIDKAADDPQRSISFSILMTLCGAILVRPGMCEVYSFASAF